MNNSSKKYFSDLCREDRWQHLKENNKWDLVVIGGGITGAGIFYRAASYGLKVLLVEQKDFAWGTSSRSSKMVHGGFRYIAQGDIKLTKEALHEREQMLKELPGLVDRWQFIFPLRKGRFPGRFSLGILLKVYDLLAGVHDSAYMNNELLEKKVAGLDIINMKGAIGYSDAVTDDTRLVMRVLQEGESHGGCLMNYLKATGFQKNAQGDIETLLLRNEENGESIAISADLFVNATGAWADKLMGNEGEDKKIRPLRGSHLVLKSEKFSLSTALTLVHPDDGRPVFMFPWYGRILLGTTDLDYPEDLDIEAAISRKEVDYLLKIVNEYFPDAKCDDKDIIATYCGVRPVISSGRGVDPSKEKRGHSIWQQGKLISVSGGKLTIWRVIADEIMEKAKTIWPDLELNPDENIFESRQVEETGLLASFTSLSTNYKKILGGRYGERLKQFLGAFPGAAYDELDNHGYSVADCFWAIQHEQVCHLDDLLFRRTRLGLLIEEDSLFIEEISEFMAEEFGWEEEKRKQEVERYRAIREQYYSVRPI